MTTKCPWGTLQRGNLIYIRIKVDPDEWTGPFVVHDVLKREIKEISGGDSFPAPEGMVARYLEDKERPNPPIELGGLDPLPPWVKGQEHEEEPLVLRKFTKDVYDRAKDALIRASFGGIVRHDTELKAHGAVIRMWEEAEKHLAYENKTLTHINLYPGGMLRCFGEVKDATIREGVAG